jgi:hypothetical protein
LDVALNTYRGIRFRSGSFVNVKEEDAKTGRKNKIEKVPKVQFRAKGVDRIKPANCNNPALPPGTVERSAFGGVSL